MARRGGNEKASAKLALAFSLRLRAPLQVPLSNGRCSSFLLMRGCWRRSRRERGVVEIEIYFGGAAGAFVGFEVSVVVGEAGHAGNQGVGKGGDVGVVVQNYVIVAAAFDGYAVFCAG